LYNKCKLIINYSFKNYIYFFQDLRFALLGSRWESNRWQRGEFEETVQHLHVSNHADCEAFPGRESGEDYRRDPTCWSGDFGNRYFRWKFFKKFCSILGIWTSFDSLWIAEKDPLNTVYIYWLIVYAYNI